MQKMRIHLAWLVLCMAGFFCVQAVSQDERQPETAGPIAVPCGLVAINVERVEEVPRLPFLFMTGHNEWKTTAHGFSPLQKKAFKLRPKSGRQSAAIIQEISTGSPSYLWSEGSNTKIWLDLLYYAWVILAIAALLVLVINYRMVKTVVALIIGTVVLMVVPGVVMNRIQSGKIVILVDNAVKDSLQLSIDNRFHFTLKPKSQTLLALKEGKRVMELSETKDYVKTTCTLDAVRLRDRFGNIEKGFYILNIHGHNKYTVSWY